MEEIKRGFREDDAMIVLTSLVTLPCLNYVGYLKRAPGRPIPTAGGQGECGIPDRSRKN